VDRPHIRSPARPCRVISAVAEAFGRARRCQLVAADRQANLRRAAIIEDMARAMSDVDAVMLMALAKAHQDSTTPSVDSRRSLKVCVQPQCGKWLSRPK
jgi:UDP-N-acetylmuramate-alanine ligase